MSNAFDSANVEKDYSYFSDAHKDAYGVRPKNWEWFKSLNAVERAAELERISVAVNEQIAVEKQQEATAKGDFDQRMADQTFALGICLKTAIRWEMDNDDLDAKVQQDVEHYLWDQGIAFSDMTEYFTLMEVSNG